MSSDQGKIRVDKWLWHARFFKTRSLASQVCRAGKVRINSNKISKPSASVSVGDVLTFTKVNDIKVVQVLALGERRGPATEAQTLYEDNSPIVPTKAEVREKQAVEGTPALREAGAGRPTKAERRATDKLMGRG